MKNSNPSQKGAFLLILVLVLGVSISLALTGYLALLTQTTRSLQGQLHSEQAHYAAYAYFSETLARQLDNSSWLSDLPTPYSQTTVLDYADIPISRRIVRDDTGITVDITSRVIQTQRKLVAFFSFGHSSATPADIALTIDQSGSMDDDGPVSPPFPCPITSENSDPMIKAICASRDFVDIFLDNPNVKIGVIKFSTQAQPVTTTLTHLVDHSAFLQLNDAISSLISDGFTAISAAINKSQQLLLDPDYAQTDAQKYLVFFTDGVATVTGTGNICNGADVREDNIICIQPGDSPTAPCLRPNGSVHPNPPTDLACLRRASNDAINQAALAKSQHNITVYTIGLGTISNHDVLKEIASDPDHFYFAPTKNELSDIFTAIAQDIQSNLIVTLAEQPPE